MSSWKQGWTKSKRIIRRLFPRLAKPVGRGSELPAPVIPCPDRKGIAVVAIVKNEENYIAEWVDYHFIIGAAQLFIYDNGSTDSTLEVLKRSRWYRQITIIPWQNFDTRVRIQNAAYNHALANFGSAFRWMTFIDVDEFIVPKRHDDLNAALVVYEDIPALSLPWHMFGPSGHDVPPPGLVIENYLDRAEFPPPRDALSLLNYKTIADPARVRFAKTHHVELRGESGIMYNDRKQRFNYDDRFDTANASAETFQLNHYFTRSLEELRLKIEKGRVSKDGRTKNAAHLESQLEKLQTNTIRDTEILRFVPALQQAIRNVGPSANENSSPPTASEHTSVGSTAVRSPEEH